MHANDALNRLVQRIGEDEAENYLKFRFGGVDSLVNEFIIREEDSDSLGNYHKERMMIISDEDSMDQDIRIEVRTDANNVLSVTNDKIELEEELKKEEQLHRIHEKLVIRMEWIHEDLEKALKWTEGVDSKIGNVETVVQHFAIESIFGGDLNKRLPKEKLEDALEEALEEEGLAGNFEYAVYNESKEDPVKDYATEDFNADEKAYSKALFPNDRKGKGYELRLQIPNEEGLIWEEIHPMIWLSIVFTLLIILAFVFALYFIWKQKKVSQIKNDFINNMTHELKTPLASISLANASIRHPEVLNDQKQIMEFTEIIEKERIRMNSHIEKVLEMASMENNEFKLKLELIDFKQLVSKSISSIGLALDNVGGEIVFNCDLDEAKIAADDFHLTNSITNILDNSIKYCDGSPKILVDLKKLGNKYQLRIKDNGIGMTSKSVKLAFDKFYREETGNIHNRKGFGLGLSYVKNIVEGHEGTVKLESELNKGTTVIIEIPASNEN